MTLFHPTGWTREPAVKRARGVAPGPRLDRVFSCGRNPLSKRKRPELPWKILIFCMRESDGEEVVAESQAKIDC